MTEEIFLKLDLGEYLDKFNSFLARQKPLFLQGDSKIHFENISELSKYDLKAPDEIKNLDDALMRLSKQAVLHISEIYLNTRLDRALQIYLESLFATLYRHNHA